MIITVGEGLEEYKKELKKQLLRHRQKVQEERDKAFESRRRGRPPKTLKQLEQAVHRASYSLDFGLDSDDYQWHWFGGMRMVLGLNENEDTRIRSDVMKEVDNLIKE